MNTGLYSCYNCNLKFEVEDEFKIHYKSEHHRYNVKRKLIGLPSLSFDDYLIQFENEHSAKSTENEFYCEICSKKYMSIAAYKQHLNSQKHKKNRKKITTKSDPSESSSCSEFSLLGGAKKLKCIFCNDDHTDKHLRSMHNFPPFEDECVNVEALLAEVRALIDKGECLYCSKKFGNGESAKQHMMDLGHCCFDLQKFAPFEKFYLWKIDEGSSEQELEEIGEEPKEKDFEDLNKVTLESLEQKRLDRIQVTTIGAKVNGREIGRREFKLYYKQNLIREIPENPWRKQHALEQQGQEPAYKHAPQRQRIEPPYKFSLKCQ